MKQMHSCILVLLMSVTIAIAFTPSDSHAETCEQWAAKVVSVEGTVETRRAGETEWRPVALNDTFCPGDKIRVQTKSRADIALANHPILRLDQNSTITLGGLKDDRTSLVDMLSGAAHFFSRVARNLEVRTASVNAGVEGTEFFIRVDDNKTFLSIFEGEVLASNQAGSLAIATGQSAVAEAGKAPSYVSVVKPRDAVQWTLYYPLIVSEYPEEPKDNDPRFYTYRASSLLRVGRVEEARADIGRALDLDPDNSLAFALQSIIAVVKNEKAKSRELAEKAVAADPESATAKLALSYAQQASFNLEGALNSLKDAVKREPENALAWSRLAELWLSFGELEEALKTAEKAVALNPRLSRTQTVLGFAYLTQVKTGKSKDAFTKAIELDSADPLPRFGLGLSKIRDGNLNEGRRDIEIAVSLDPDNSLARSYLGKAYFEEKRDKLSVDQFEMAKNLDPLDPTPFFYDAIRKQTVNRPVEALHDLQKAVELNDNRAVYRSRLLLDEDLAARSASLARIYSDLGFQELALVEGWKSLNTDPANFSAHRFLADSYSFLPRHEIARVSELLQSQLLQPLNITPIQPRLSESNLFLLSAGGPASLSFNEFNPLFNRNRVALQTSAIVGENDTFGEEATISGIYKNASFSVGQTHFESDGWRENADQDDDIVNAFAQFQLSPKTSIQAEYRYRDIERGDLQLRFFEFDDDFLPDLREEDETNLIRLGFRHAFSPDSVLIGNFAYQNADRMLFDLFFIPLDFPPPLEDEFTINTDEDAYSGEIQHLFRSKYLNITSGAGYFDIDKEDVFRDKVFDPFFDPPVLVDLVTEDVETDIEHFNFYIYSYINFLKNVTITLGASADFYESDDKDRDSRDLDEDQINPKFGITWNPFADTLVRGAVFKTLKRTLITDQTLEPTQVAGFNQFFDDFNAAETWRSGIGIDQKFSKSIYGGVEYSKRDLDVPFFDIPPPPAPPDPELGRADWEEYLFRTYLYWTPHQWLALSADYQYEKFERDKEFTFAIREVETHRIPLAISFFHPSGLSAMVKTTYYDQEGQFEKVDTPAGVFFSGGDNFWVVDAAISYRLPRRYGLLSIGAKNLFDESFKYHDTDPVSPAIQPDRMFFAQITLSF